jgi:hypothetical protein
MSGLSLSGIEITCQGRGQDGNRKDMRFTKLVPVVMDIAHAGTKSDYTCDEAYEKSTALRDLIESILANMISSVPTDGGSPSMDE